MNRNAEAGETNRGGETAGRESGEAPGADVGHAAASADDRRSPSDITAQIASKPGDVGHLLRGAYRQTIEEAIPDDLMDLLNKLE